MTGHCPECARLIHVSDYAETVICRKCGAWFHPEQLRRYGRTDR